MAQAARYTRENAHSATVAAAGEASVVTGPFLLYIGHAANPLDIKTSRGVAVFRAADCLGEFRHDDSPLTLDLPRLGFVQARASGARTLILGIAAAGGRLTETMADDVVEALEAGLDVASGLHHRLRDHPRIARTAAANGRLLHDVRDPPAGLSVGTGLRRPGRRLLTVGTDCAVGKMFTALLLARELDRRGIAATFRATGQTGILISGAGVPVDAVVADFIAGSIEALSPAREDGGWDVIEGQGSLFHPSFAGVSTGLLHGAQPDAMVLCHDPSRPHVRGLPHRQVPDVAECIAANERVARLTNPDARVVGIALNTSAMTAEAGSRACAAVEQQTGLPCVDAVVQGTARIVDTLATCGA